VHQKLVHSTPNIRSEMLILWRRLAGGLTRGQQLMIAEPCLASIRALARQMSGKPIKGSLNVIRPEEAAELWRLLGSLELLPIETKQELGELAMALKDKPRVAPSREPIVWALGRLGQRKPLYGPLNTVLAPQVVEPWITRLMEQQCNSKDRSTLFFTVAQLSRFTADRYRDVEETVRRRVADWLAAQHADGELLKLVLQGGELGSEHHVKLFGESLPLGLRLE
jgi:hypothetical protein